MSSVPAFTHLILTTLDNDPSLHPSYCLTCSSPSIFPQRIIAVFSPQNANLLIHRFSDSRRRLVSISYGGCLSQAGLRAICTVQGNREYSLTGASFKADSIVLFRMEVFDISRSLEQRAWRRIPCTYNRLLKPHRRFLQPTERRPVAHATGIANSNAVSHPFPMHCCAALCWQVGTRVQEHVPEHVPKGIW